jgi:SAM-dependent methyltransferase
MPTRGPDGDSWGEDDNARHYDAFARQHPIYRDTSRDLIALAELSADAAVLDLACGTGVTSREILAALGPGGQVTGADNSAAMLDVAARAIAAPRVTWVPAPAENIDRHVTVPIDAVVCNSAIWQTDLAATAAAVRTLLVGGGRFVFNKGAAFLAQQPDPNFPDDRLSPIAVMRDIAAQDHGWRPPDCAAPPSGRPRWNREFIRRCLDGAGFDVEQVTEFTYQRGAGAERAWLSVPIFTKYYLPGLSYEDRMRVLAKAYARLGSAQPEPSRWVAFAARPSGRPDR